MTLRYTIIKLLKDKQQESTELLSKESWIRLSVGLLAET